MYIECKGSYGIQSESRVVELFSITSEAEGLNRNVGHLSLRGDRVTACSVCTLLHHLCETVGDGERGVDEAFHTAHEARLSARVQF